jgi:hypothetical protein
MDVTARLFERSENLHVPPLTYRFGNELPDRWQGEEVVRGPGTHILACRRIAVRKLMAFDDDGNLVEGAQGNVLPDKFIRQYEQNQVLAHCCRHPENHDIAAWYSNVHHFLIRRPDIYILHCKCGRQHRRLMVGLRDERPTWEAC